MDERVKQALVDYRKKVSASGSIKGYRVLSDADIDLIATKRPKTIKDLTTLKGFPKGGAKVTKYGEDIVAIVMKPEAISVF